MSFLKKLFKGPSPEIEYFKYVEGEKTVDSAIAYFVADTTINGILHPAETMVMISWSNMGKLCFEVFGAEATSYYFYAPDRKPTIHDKGASDGEVMNLHGDTELAHLLEIVTVDGLAYRISVPQSCTERLLSF